MNKHYPPVSTIVTCFNHGRFLPEALESIYLQNYPNLEIIVVDDGSTDDTSFIAKKSPQVKYVYQNNQGLSSARNTGIKNSSGEYLVFLDADDLLLPDAFETNLFYLKQDETLAFISGAYQNVYVESGRIDEVIKNIQSEHYLNLLRINYIGMHATVMYRRRIFDEFLFDEHLKACEDYDIYLKIARKYPIRHHTKIIASYRHHGHNMSDNHLLMVTTALEALGRQKKNLLDDAERKALKDGEKFWKGHYYPKLYWDIISEKFTTDKKTLFKIFVKHPGLFYTNRYDLKSLPIMVIKSFIKHNSPAFVRRLIHKRGLYKNFSPPLGKIDKGDFNRTTPFNTDFGYSRGGPVDRYYIENFLEKQSGSIKGTVLEIADDEYTLRYGGSKVTKSEILHIDDTNPKATIVADLSDAAHLPDESFDCIILTQTLQFIYSFKDALETCRRILKPGGTLLLTVPGITHIDQHGWKDYWLWSFTGSSIKRLLSEIFSAENVSVESYGNVLVAAAFLYGIGLPEMTREQMDFNDPHYQVIISATAVKSL